MSCEKCEKAQIDMMEGQGIIFMRIGRANVIIGACEEHFREVQGLIKAGMDVEKSRAVDKHL